MNKHKKICRLCLKKCDHFQAIEEVTKEILEVLLLKLDLDVSATPVMCTNCAQNLKKIFDFKSKCLHTQDYVVPFVSRDENTKVDLRQVFMNCKEGEKICDSYNICGICMDLVKTGSFTALNNVDEQGILQRIMLEQCLPELDLNATKEPVICMSCKESLQIHFSFVTDCLKIEEIIKIYGEAEGVNGTKMNLNSILQFMTKDMLCAEDDSSEVSAIELEEQCIEEENTNGEVEIEKERHTSQQDVESFQMCVALPQPEISVRLSEKQKSSIQQSPQSPSGITVYKSELSLVKIKDKINEMVHRDGGKVIMYNCQSCTFSTKYKSTLNTHVLIHKNVSQATMYPCQCCSYQTRYKGNLKKHLPMHYSCSDVNVYQCKSCPFQTKSNNEIRTHVSTHKSSSKVAVTHQKFTEHTPKTVAHKNVGVHINATEMQIYQCGSCSYQSKYKANLKTHALRRNHRFISKQKNDSDLCRTIFTRASKLIPKYHSCSYRTRSNGILKKDVSQNTVNHKKPLDICENSLNTTYQCKTSRRQEKYKKNLDRRIHSGRSKRRVYQSRSCLNNVEYNRLFKKHMPKRDVHSEKPYRCGSCLFRAQYKRELRAHVCKQRVRPKIPMHKCDCCSFQTKYKKDLEKHKFTHISVSETATFQCKFCCYHTKYEAILKKHVYKNHKSTYKRKETSETQCKFCSYRTKNRKILKTHMLKHYGQRAKNGMYLCYSCTFQTKHKNVLNAHELMHKDPSEITMYQCEKCSYQSKYKGNLKKHAMIHGK